MNSVFKKNKWTFIFWGIQLLYWGAQYTQWYFNAYFVEGYTFSALHKFSVVVDFSTTLIIIGIITYFLNKYLSWNELRPLDVLKVIIAIVIGVFIWGPMHSSKIGNWLHFLFFPNESFPKVIISLDNEFVQSFIKAFQFASCILSYICVKVFINFNEERLKTVQLASSLHQAQLNNLKDQINPHFLFNNLNNIRGLMMEDRQKSADMLTQLSGILEYALNENELDTISIAQELKMVGYYINLSKMQFESRLQYSQHVSPKILNYNIPPMTIQLLIENAIKHGISNIKEGGIVKLNIEEDNGKLQIKVLNSGQLINVENTTGIGLKNIRQRLKFIYGDEAILTLNEKEENVIAQITLPNNLVSQ